jgi:hypothetical protein
MGNLNPPAAITGADPATRRATYAALLAAQVRLWGGISVGRFHLTAEGTKDQGTLTLDASAGPAGLPLATATGSGSDSGSDYQIRGKVGVTTPAGVGRGTFSLTNREGFKLDANYVGVQFGPLGLARASTLTRPCGRGT